MRGKPLWIHRLCVNRYIVYAWETRKTHIANVQRAEKVNRQLVEEDLPVDGEIEYHDLRCL
jgi:hypothetical protein